MKTVLVTILFSLVFACGANDGILKSGRDNSAANNVVEKTPFAKDLEAVQTVGYNFVFVLRRRDGGKFDAEDRRVIRANTDGVPRRVAADEDKAFILGSNFQISPDNLKALYGRFNVEDHSPPPVANGNSNSNANK